MKILVVGSGGREHALAWKLAQSPKATRISCAPGNGGTRLVAENIPISDHDVAKLADFALQSGIDLTVVGPEVPLSLGLVDAFESKGLRVFGPTRKAAELESSKIFAKQFMARHKIPTGRFKTADSADKARAVLQSGELGWPVVLKADGLAAGKGVIIAGTPAEAEAAVRAILVERQFGSAGDHLLIEEFLRGRETSFIVISDGTQVLPLVTTMDHKAAYDGGKGPNTGGMGTISPSPHVDRALFAQVMSTIVLPTVTRMKEEGRTYKGALYCGLMLTAEGPKVLEYNCRFGDPETQPQMLRLESDLVDILNAAIDGNVLADEVRWNAKAAGCVILASGGYPGPYEKGRLIRGLETAAAKPGIAVFHAGTQFENGAYRTSGGRVLGVCAAGRTLKDAMDRIYAAASEIEFDGAHYRSDIGAAAEPV
ncbi:MAG: phosphoribosylamine--glycine ligase [Acidobacteriota bacterium]|nr:phosphoribosylamine--glycine ligase [Acidobacteriota bacterium]